jgi:hypothetical protein
MSAGEAHIYYDEKGQPVMVQMGINEYEKLVTRAKEASESRDRIQKALSLLNAQ